MKDKLKNGVLTQLSVFKTIHLKSLTACPICTLICEIKNLIHHASL